MTRWILAGAAALGMMTGAAMAQTTTSETSTTTGPASLPVPTGTVSTTSTQKSIGFDGTRTDSAKTTYSNSDGVASDTLTKTTTFPPPPAVTTTTETTTTKTQ